MPLINSAANDAESDGCLVTYADGVRTITYMVGAVADIDSVALRKAATSGFCFVGVVIVYVNIRVRGFI